MKKSVNKQTNIGDNNKEKITAIQHRNIPGLVTVAGEPASSKWQIHIHKKTSFEEEGRNKHTQTE